MKSWLALRPASALLVVLLVVLPVVTMGCAAPLRYAPPPLETPAAFKEDTNWKPAQPRDAAERRSWWEMFGDPDLNEMESAVVVSNQSIAAAVAQFAQARAILRNSRASLLPQVNSRPSIGVSQPSGNRAATSYHDVSADFLLPADVSYEADVWGRVRNSVEASRTAAQARAADVESVALSVRAELAVDYFTLRGLDRQKELFDSAVTAFERALELTQNRFRGGIASQADVALAETLLETTRAQAVDIEVARASLEHAIAVLLGRPASAYAVSRLSQASSPPDVPVGVPSDLLERRPDIASAERRVAAANAQVGVATAAYYPLLLLTGSGGFESSSFGSWLATASNFWSVAPTALITVFDGGRRRAVSDQARAVYAQTIAEYRESVLSALREVEDQLATLRVLDEERAIQDRAVQAAERSLELANNRYRGGVTTYLEVITVQSLALANQRAAASILTRRMNATVLLVKALGGDWRDAQLPSLLAGTTPTP